MLACAFELPVNLAWSSCHGVHVFVFGRVCQRLSIHMVHLTLVAKRVFPDFFGEVCFDMKTLN